MNKKLLCLIWSWQSEIKVVVWSNPSMSIVIIVIEEEEEEEERPGEKVSLS